MKRLECMHVLASLLTDEVVVSALGGTTDEWFSVRPGDGTFAQSCMGANVPFALGLSLALPHRRVVVLDSDGCQLMTLGALATLGNQRPPNLRVFVFDNGAYGYTGGQASATSGQADLAAVARALGLEEASTVYNLPDFEAAAREALAADHPSYCVAKVEMVPGRFPGGGPNRHDQATRFIHFIEKTEGVKILGEV